MKTPKNPRSKAGFTLIELLVVITIIAVLAAAGFASGNAAMQRARKVTAQAAATSIVTSIDQFYSEYSALPSGTGTLPTGTGGSGVAVINILAGLETGTTIENDRKIKFLSLKESKNGKRDGAVFNTAGTSINALFDPWGRPYYIVMDDNYDERISITPGNSIPQVNLNGRRAAAYSLGVKVDNLATSGTFVKTW